MNASGPPTPAAVTRFPIRVAEPGVALVHRLIVLVPDVDWEDNEWLYRIRGVAAAQGARVLLLGVCVHIAEEARLRRHLVTMAAALRSSRVATEFRIEAGDGWIEKLSAVWQPGDLVVCDHGERPGTRRTLLGQLLASSLQAPIYVLPGSYRAQPPRPTLWPGGALWVGALVILAAFFWLQVRISQLTHNWGQTILLTLSVVVEFALLWIWNSLSA